MKMESLTGARTGLGRARTPQLAYVAARTAGAPPGRDGTAADYRDPDAVRIPLNSHWGAKYQTRGAIPLAS